MEFNYPLDMTRPQALTRRANMFIEWLHREEYNTYTGPESMQNMVRLIKIIQEAFSETILVEYWLPFKRLFMECRLQLQDTYETEEVSKVNFDQVVISLIQILEQYKVYMPDHVIGE